MINFIGKIIKEEKGSYMVIFAAGMVFFLGLAAVVTDISFLTFQRRHLQNTADAAALAAAWELPTASVAESVAKDYANSNGVDKDDTFVELINENREVKVEISSNYPRFLGRIFGSEEYSVSVLAVASRDFAGMNVLPFTTVHYNDFREDNDIDDWEDDWKYANIDEFFGLMSNLIDDEGTLELLLWAKSGGDPPGNWGLLDLEDFADDANNIKQVLDAITEGGLDHSICEEDNNNLRVVETEPGQVSSIIKSNAEHLQNAIDAVNDREGAWIILATPEFVDNITGKVQIEVPEEVIFAYIDKIEECDLDADVPSLKANITKVVKDCPIKPTAPEYIDIFLVN